MASPKISVERPTVAPAPIAMRSWLVVLLSASNFPKYPAYRDQREKNETFRRSCRAVRNLFDGLGTADMDCLDLTDWTGSPGSLLDRIDVFVAERSDAIARVKEKLTDIVFYYVGHGLGRGDAYSLLLRDSDPRNLELSTLRFASLVSRVKQSCDESRNQHGFEIRQYYILDACFSGCAKHATQDVTGIKVVKRDENGHPACGISVLCSCNEKEESLAPAGQKYTLFTTAFLTTLACPAEERELMQPLYPKTQLSLSHLRIIISQWLTRRTPTPEEVPPAVQVHSLDTIAGDLQDVPLFPNPFGPEGMTWREKLEAPAPPEPEACRPKVSPTGLNGQPKNRAGEFSSPSVEESVSPVDTQHTEPARKRFSIKLNRRSTIVLCLLLLFTLFSGTMASLYASGKLQVHVALLSTIVPAAFMATGVILFGPFLGLMRDRNRNESYKVMVYGHSGSGKSSFIKHALGHRGDPVSTQDLTLYSATIALGLCLPGRAKPPGARIGSRHAEVTLADYRGQKPGQVITDPDPEFFGPRGRREIDAVLFVVDFFPTYEHKGSNRAYDDEEVLQRVSASTEAIIRKRAEDHARYLTEYNIQFVFDVVLSSEVGKLKAVKLLINKKDLLEKAVKRGLLPGVNQKTYPAFQEGLIGEIRSNIKKFCDANNIDDFQVMRVNATDQGQTFTVLRNVLAECSRKGAVRGA